MTTLPLATVSAKGIRMHLGRFLTAIAAVASSTGLLATILAVRSKGRAAGGRPVESDSLDITGYEQLAERLPDIALGMALFMSILVILMTLRLISITTDKSLALLRAVGATPMQGLLQVVWQALVIGIVGCILGLGVGSALMALLPKIAGNVDSALPGVSALLLPEVLIWTFAAGILTTLIAAILPACKIAWTAPAAALRRSEGANRSSPRRQIVVGTVMFVGSLGLISLGAPHLAKSSGLLVTVGTVTLLVSLVTLSSALSILAAALFVMPLRWLSRTPARLAVKNTLRSTRRTTAVSSVFLIGLTFVNAILVLSASINDPIDSEGKGIPEELRHQMLNVASEMQPLLRILLGLFVFIAATSIFTIYFLSSLERTYEIGLLRGAGMGRFGETLMVVFEVFITSILSGLIGVISGSGLAATLQTFYAKTDYPEVIAPWSVLIWTFLGALCLAAVAATIPIVHSSRMKVLKAIDTA